jgi:hypothetical protein
MSQTRSFSDRLGFDFGDGCSTLKDVTSSKDCCPIYWGERSSHCNTHAGRGCTAQSQQFPAGENPELPELQIATQRSDTTRMVRRLSSLNIAHLSRRLAGSHCTSSSRRLAEPRLRRRCATAHAAAPRTSESELKTHPKWKSQLIFGIARKTMGSLVWNQNPVSTL